MLLPQRSLTTVHIRHCYLSLYSLSFSCAYCTTATPTVVRSAYRFHWEFFFAVEALKSSSSLEYSKSILVFPKSHFTDFVYYDEKDAVRAAAQGLVLTHYERFDPRVIVTWYAPIEGFILVSTDNYLDYWKFSQEHMEVITQAVNFSSKFKAEDIEWPNKHYTRLIEHFDETKQKLSFMVFVVEPEVLEMGNKTYFEHVHERDIKAIENSLRTLE